MPTLVGLSWRAQDCFRSRSFKTILTKVVAQRVVMKDGRAIGVEVKQSGQLKVVEAEREVILSAGSFGSPQLLLLSGIGPRDELAAHGIAVQHESAGVGQNLQDHLDYVMSYHSKRDDVVGLGPKGLAQLGKAALQWRKDGTGHFASPFAEGGAFLKSDSAQTRPDLQLHFVVGIVDVTCAKCISNMGFHAMFACCVRRRAGRLG